MKQVSRFEGEEYPLAEFREWLAANPARAQRILEGLRLMDSAEAERRSQDPSMPGYYTRGRHIDVLVEAVERGVIPNDWMICHTREEMGEHMREIIDDPERYEPVESVESVLSDMLGWKELERYDADAEALGMRNRGIYWDACKKLKAMRKEAGVSLDEMARRTGLSATALWRAENDLHRVGLLDLLLDYCAALGKTFEITIKDADQD